MSDLRPHQRLPYPEPKLWMPEDPNHFYDNFASHFIEDTIQMMNVGMVVDDAAVERLRKRIEKVLKVVHKSLGRNPLVKAYIEQRTKVLQEKHRAKATANIRVLGDFIREYKPKDITHRTWIINTYLESLGRKEDTREKWTLSSARTFNKEAKLPYLKAVLSNVDIGKAKFTLDGMKALGEHKLDLYNRPRYAKADSPIQTPIFNPGSSVQKAELFAMLNIEALAVSSSTGKASWGRDQIEELLSMSTDKKMVSLLTTLVDFSYSGIMQSNFLKSFDSYTIDGVLHGNVKLVAAKSMRNTSNSPNLLNFPSTRSIYAKPLKECFIAPEGYLVFAIDYSALENRVMANLSGDTNAIKVFTDGLDGHSLNTLGYGFDEIPELNALFSGIDDKSKGKFYEVTDVDGNVTYEREFI